MTSTSCHEFALSPSEDGVRANSDCIRQELTAELLAVMQPPDQPASPEPNSNPPPVPPPPPSGPLPGGGEHLSGISKEERLWAAFSHLVFLIIWLIKREGMPFVDDQGKEALNFHITVIIGMVAVGIVSHIPFLGCVLVPLTMIAMLGASVLCIIGAIKANDGIKYRYPWSLKLVK
jgi:uncharacterized protein